MNSLLSLLLFLFPAVALAGTSSSDNFPTLVHTPQFRKLTVEAGLPSSKVYKLAQDKEGFLWMGTDDGLARYDGVQFQVWRHDANDPNSLASNSVSTLYIDPNNRLWCGGEDIGLNLLDAERRQFQHFRHDDKDPASLTSNDVWAIAQDVNGVIWVGGYNSGLDRLQANFKDFDHHRHDANNPSSIASDNVLNLLPTHDGRLWVGTDAGLDRRTLDGKFEHVDLSFFGDVSGVNIVNLLADGEGVIAVTNHGAVKVNSQLRAERISLPAHADPRLYSLVRDSAGELWMGSRHGLLRQQSQNKVDLYRANPYTQNGLPGEIVFDALRDHEGGLWFALLDGGVVQLSPQWKNFSIFQYLPDNPKTLSANTVTGFSIDQSGNLWAVNVHGAIDKLDPVSGSVERYAIHLDSSQKNLLSVLSTQKNQVWVGHQNGLRVYELTTKTFRDIPMDAKKINALPVGFVDQISTDIHGKIWISAHGGGLAKIDPDSFAITRFTPDNSGLRSSDIEQFGFTPDGNMLVATALGIDWFDAVNQRFHPVEAIPVQRIHAFAFAPDGTFWLHRLGILEQYRLAQDKAVIMQRIDSSDGWPTLIARGLELDSSGVLWIATPRGLFRVDPLTHAIRSFDTHDGLPSSELRALALGKNGHIFAMTLASGLFAFHPLVLEENSIPPPLLLTNIAVRRGAKDLSFTSRQQEAFSFQWNDRDIRVEARALSYANTAGNRYQFQLAGLESEWINTGERGVREFNQLPPGNYQLNVRAANASGIWNQADKILQIHVAPPPWKTWWAYAFYLLVFAFTVWLLFYLYQKRLQRHYQLELANQQRRSAEQASAAKSLFLATMGHEIRTPMTGVLGMTELLLRTSLNERQLSYAEAIQQSGQLMLQQVNDALDLARIEAGMMNLNCDIFDITALLDEAITFLQPLAARKSLQLDKRIVGDSLSRRYGDALRIKQILLNLGNNAIKFTEHGSVRFELTLQHRYVEIQVCDTGPGISAETLSRLFQPFVQADGSITQRHGGSGLGLAICRELAMCMGGDIRATSEVGQGSIFIVNLPLQCAEENKLTYDKVASNNLELNSNLKKSLRILLVEDNTTIARVIQEMLESMGHYVRHCPNGLAALAELSQEKMDLVLVDLDLPGIDGHTLARMWRQREHTQNLSRLPMIAITARSGGNEESQALEAGMNYFLRKPLTIAQLMAAIEKIMPFH